MEKTSLKKNNRHCSHHESFREEISSHLPYAIVSVTLSIIALSIWVSNGLSQEHAHKYFHGFHFLHLLFSGIGVVLIFRKYSKSIPVGILTGFSVPAVFCTLSDSILPFLGGKYLGLDMHYHICFWDHITTVIPFLSAGVLIGFVISSYSGKRLFYSAGSHFSHILISSMASILYFYSYGFVNLFSHMGFVFIYLICAVLIPCSLADIVVPMTFAGLKIWDSK